MKWSCRLWWMSRYNSVFRLGCFYFHGQNPISARRGPRGMASASCPKMSLHLSCLGKRNASPHLPSHPSVVIPTNSQEANHPSIHPCDQPRNSSRFYIAFPIPISPVAFSARYQFGSIAKVEPSHLAMNSSSAFRGPAIDFWPFFCCIPSAAGIPANPAQVHKCWAAVLRCRMNDWIRSRSGRNTHVRGPLLLVMEGARHRDPLESIHSCTLDKYIHTYVRMLWRDRVYFGSPHSN